MKLGFVTYQIGRDWDVPTIIDMCGRTDFTGVELRTTHAHGVEAALSSHERRTSEGNSRTAEWISWDWEQPSSTTRLTRPKFAATSWEPLEYTKLAADLGCPGVKVRPNGLQTELGVPEEKTLDQIGRSIGECAKAADGLGVQIRVEVHGRDTQEPRRMRAIMDHADHPNARICWNSNFGEVVDGSVEENYRLLSHKISLVHITEISRTEYPWRELFRLLKADGYDGYALAEINHSPEPERLMGYYRALWQAYQE